MDAYEYDDEINDEFIMHFDNFQRRFKLSNSYETSFDNDLDMGNS